MKLKCFDGPLLVKKIVIGKIDRKNRKDGMYGVIERELQRKVILQKEFFIVKHNLYGNRWFEIAIKS